jgi:DNA gyrase subunit A
MPSAPPPSTDAVALHEAARVRYLNYALSVITARALPDVRDGLKPVQRRILYAMYNNLRLLPEGRYRKSAAVVGEVMAKFHPHGDSSIYEALVRLAQPFSLLHPLVDGQGNFGSLDGDGAAAMRYTECKLQPIAIELLSELRQRTVAFRPNYDGQHFEPVVLPAQFPQILVGGSEGIAVGMATRIPPHNLREVVDACVKLIEDPETSIARLFGKVKGPDFPTGGVILNAREELKQIYETGQGAVRLRGTWRTERKGRKASIVIDSIPYALVKSTLVEKIGELIREKKIPQLTDVRDESTDEVRIVCELRREEDAEPAMAYLFKHTPLQTSYPVNLTCLFPTPKENEDDPEIGAPARADLKTILRAWLDFRFETVKKRFAFDLQELKDRIHILDGFATVFDMLDQAIKIIRGSDGKRDAAEKLMAKFEIDDVQTEAILELRLYKLAKLEILLIREELAEKTTEAARIEKILASKKKLWDVITDELTELKKLYGIPRKTQIGGDEAAPVAFEETHYIVQEDTYVFVTRDGWIKRQASFTDVDKIRIREGDAIGWVAKASTRSTVAFFTDQGVAYVLRVDDLPSTTGYGEPVQRHFKFADGERVVGVIVHDRHALPEINPLVAQQYDEENPPPPHGVAVTKHGKSVRFPISLHAEVSNKNGRRYMKPDDGLDESGRADGVLAVYLSDGTEFVSLATEPGRALTFPVSEINVVKGAGKGVTAIKTRPEDPVIAFELVAGLHEGARVFTASNRVEVVRPSKHAGTRAGRGSVVMKRGKFERWEQRMVRYDQLYAGTNGEGGPAGQLAMFESGGEEDEN